MTMYAVYQTPPIPGIPDCLAAGDAVACARVLLAQATREELLAFERDDLPGLVRHAKPGTGVVPMTAVRRELVNAAGAEWDAQEGE